MGVRRAVARELDLSETMEEEVDDYEASGLQERHKVALRFADAFLLDPAGTSSDLRAAVVREFGADGLAELVVDLVKFRGWSKLFIAFGPEPQEGELAVPHVTPVVR